MNDRLSALGKLTIVMNVRHDIVTKLAFQLGNTVPIKRVAVLAQFLDLVLGYRESQLLLGIR